MTKACRIASIEMRMAVGRDGDELSSDLPASSNVWLPVWVKRRLATFDHGFHQLLMGLTSSEAGKMPNCTLSGQPSCELS